MGRINMYLKKLNAEYLKIIFESLENEFILDENEIIYNGLKLAIVPGSFKPPHKGHWEMVMNYVDKVDKVIVLISNISTKAIAERPLSLTNLKQFGKIKQFAIDNNIINDEITHVFDEIEALTETLNFVDLKRNLEKLILCSKDIDDVDLKYVKKFQLMIQTYLNRLNETLFKSIRHAGNLEITPEVSKQIFEIFAKANNVTDKVDIIIPDSASPITATIGFVNFKCKNCDILLGVSTKGGDEARWNGIEKSIKNETNHVVADPVNVKTMLSATDLRNNIGNLKKEYFPDCLSENDFEEIKNLLK
jgi:hypothetical protein